MRRALGIVLALATVAAACGDGGDSSPDPGSAGDCDQLADIGIEMIQDGIDDVGSVSLDEFLAASTAGEQPEALARMERQADALEARAEELGCTEADAQELLCSRVDRLDSDSEVGDLLLQSFLSACSRG